MTRASRFVGKFVHATHIMLTNGVQLNDINLFIDEHFIVLDKGDDPPDLINIQSVVAIQGVTPGLQQ